MPQRRSSEPAAEGNRNLRFSARQALALWFLLAAAVWSLVGVLVMTAVDVHR